MSLCFNHFFLEFLNLILESCPFFHPTHILCGGWISMQFAAFWSLIIAHISRTIFAKNALFIPSKLQNIYAENLIVHENQNICKWSECCIYLNSPYLLQPNPSEWLFYLFIKFLNFNICKLIRKYFSKNPLTKGC